MILRASGLVGFQARPICQPQARESITHAARSYRTLPASAKFWTRGPRVVLRRYAPLPVTLVPDDLPVIEIKIIGDSQFEHIFPR
jgi:hypothetical protein